MGFLDFLFGKRKQVQPKAQPKAASKTPVQSVREPIAPQSVKHQEQPMSSKPSIPTMKPFVFKSDCHQRFENGNEVMGLQQCVRTVSVEKNTNGCRGYKLNPGEGYIVKVFNDDLGKPNMSDKPMRIVSKTADKVELRGFPIEAQTPFGWQEVDYSDYGFTVYYSNGKVAKCVLHMFDRNVDLEYRSTGKKIDRYSVMIENSSFNPFNLTVEPSLQNTQRLPNMIGVFQRELSSLLCNELLPQVQSPKDIVKGYIFNLVESYYNNAGYVPKNTLDEIFSQCYTALSNIGQQNIFSSKDELFYEMYFCFLNN